MPTPTNTVVVNQLDTINKHFIDIDLKLSYLKNQFDLTQTTPVNHLDTITKHLTAINQKLYFLKHQSEMDTGLEIKDFYLLISTLVVAYLGYLWVRNKEYRTKKGQIAGEINSLIYDFKIALYRHTVHNIHYCANRRILEIYDNEEWRYSADAYELQMFDPTIYRNERDNSYKEMEEQRQKLYQSRKALVKCFGEYKFYLSGLTRDEFKAAIDPLLKWKLSDYSYVDTEDKPTVDEKRNTYLSNLPKDLEIKYKRDLDCIDAFLEANID